VQLGSLGTEGSSSLLASIAWSEMERWIGWSDQGRQRMGLQRWCVSAGDHGPAFASTSSSYGSECRGYAAGWRRGGPWTGPAATRHGSLPTERSGLVTHSSSLSARQYCSHAVLVPIQLDPGSRSSPVACGGEACSEKKATSAAFGSVYTIHTDVRARGTSLYVLLYAVPEPFRTCVDARHRTRCICCSR
jgi:hypothetical protein